VGLGLAAIPFMSLIYGITVGRYNYKVIKRIFSRILDAFDGFTITQISDVHSGSFDNPEKISYAIDLVNEQNSDMILFTGDVSIRMPRRCILGLKRSIELKKHEYGKYSVLGTMIMENMSLGQQR
jgi:predicted MPP superfamily phosphohydrolase